MRYVHIILIVLVGFAVYAGGVSGKFIWDDETLIRNNSYIRDLSNADLFFKGRISSSPNSKGYSFYRPLQMISYALDYRFWKLNPGGYHLTNIFLHIIAALCLFWFLNVLYRDRVLSIFAALFFIVHPVHSEAVSYISGRSDLLAAAFLLLSLVFYLKNNIVLVVVAYIASLLSRETALVLPFLLSAYHFIKKTRPNVKLLLPVAGISFAYILLRLTFLRGLLTSSVSPTDFFGRIPGFFAALSGYLRVLLVPLRLHMEYGDRQFGFMDIRVLSGIVIFAALCFLIFKRKRNRDISFLLSWFLIGLLPVSNLYPVSAYMAEHWLYFPSMGLFIIAGKYFADFYRTKNLRKYAFAFIVLLLIFSSYLTMRQDSYWKEPIVFYERTLRYSPDNWKIYNNLGIEYYKEGYIHKSINAFEKSIRINPDYEGSRRNLEKALKNR